MFLISFLSKVCIFFYIVNQIYLDTKSRIDIKIIVNPIVYIYILFSLNYAKRILKKEMYVFYTLYLGKSKFIFRKYNKIYTRHIISYTAN